MSGFTRKEEEAKCWWEGLWELPPGILREKGWGAGTHAFPGETAWWLVSGLWGQTAWVHVLAHPSEPGPQLSLAASASSSVQWE